MSKEDTEIAAQKDRRNEAITAREVRVIDPEGEQVGIMPINDALAKAAEYGLDLVEVSPPFDSGGGTAWLGVSIMFELMCVLATSIAARREGAG